MARRTAIRPMVTPRGTAGAGHPYVIRKHRRNDPDRLVPRDYDPSERRHVELREQR
ncbi:50S ribosomal protein L33 [Rugosimonospora acidiphila]|uniref:Large ribosomal subunit protein bL33 n=1 Tax=Rugosimonospora acidiphila TaxID=556531 RepID=A0ABP9S009_9ACTN